MKLKNPLRKLMARQMNTSQKEIYLKMDISQINYEDSITFKQKALQRQSDQ